MTTLVEPSTLVGRRVRVHYNLHRGDFAVIDPTVGPVVCYVDDITLDGCEFRVGEKSRLRSIATGQRAVMAYGIGTCVAVNTSPNVDRCAQVTYNPFRCGAFHDKRTGEPVWNAPTVIFHHAYCWTPPTNGGIHP